MQLEVLTIFSQTNDICQYDGSALLVVLSMAILYVSLVVFHLHRNSTIHSRALTRKDDFVSRSGNDYGYATSQRGHINTWRGTEFPNLISPLVRSTKISSTTAQGEELIVYLDYAGAALPAKTQLQNIFEKVPAILANPHSTGPAASKSSLLIEQAKTRILDLLNGHPSRIKNHVGYEVLFTSGTTEALRIVANASHGVVAVTNVGSVLNSCILTTLIHLSWGCENVRSPMVEPMKVTPWLSFTTKHPGVHPSHTIPAA